MTTTLNITGIGPLDRASIPLPEPGQINLVAGRNQAGKSTVCRATAALTVRDPLVLGRMKRDRADLLRPGMVAGSVALMQDQASYRIDLPAGEAVEGGSASDLPRLSRVAAGLDRPARMTEKERAACLGAALRATPTAEDWIRACAAVPGPLPPDLVGMAWKTLEKAGWDNGATDLATEATKAKGSWCQVTGARAFAAKEGAKWQPEGHATDLMTLDLEALRHELVAARAARDAVVASGAVDQDRRAKLEAKAKGLEELRAEVARFRTTMEERQRQLAETEAAIASSPIRGGIPCDCPHCGKKLEIHGEAIRKGKGSDEDYATQSKLVVERNHHRAGLDGATAAHERAAKRLEAAEAAATELAGLSTVDHGTALADATAAVERIEALGKAAKATREAREIHGRVMALIKLAELAGPAGVRKTKLEALLGLLNDDLADLSAAMGTEAVRIEPDMAVMRGSLPFEVLSQSAQWRVDAILAVALARRDGSAFVVLDGADVLDLPGRRGLVEMLRQAEVGALVTLTASKPEAVPALGGIEVWLADGTATVIGEEAMAA